MDLRNKKSLRIVITGASSGFGFSLTKYLLQNGHKICICCRTEERIQKTVEMLKDMTKNDDIQLYGKACDVQFHEQVIEFTKFCVEKLGCIDLWVQNAAIVLSDSKDIFEIDYESVKSSVLVNYVGAVNCCKSCISIMKDQDEGGQFMFMDGWGSNGETDHELMSYSSSKCALKLATKHILIDMKKLKIKKVGINCYNPGMLLTPPVITNSTNLEANSKHGKAYRMVLEAIALPSDDSAQYLVKVLKNLKGTGKSFSFISKFWAGMRFFKYFAFGIGKGKYFDKDGKPTKFVLDNVRDVQM